MLSTIFKRPLKTTFILKVSMVLLLLLFFLVRYLDGFMFVALDWVKIVLFNSLLSRTTAFILFDGYCLFFFVVVFLVCLML